MSKLYTCLYLLDNFDKPEGYIGKGSCSRDGKYCIISLGRKLISYSTDHVPPEELLSYFPDFPYGNSVQTKNLCHSEFWHDFSKDEKYE